MVQGVGGLGSLYSVYRSGYLAGVGAAGSELGAGRAGGGGQGAGSGQGGIGQGGGQGGGAGLDVSTIFQRMDSDMRSFMLQMQSDLSAAGPDGTVQAGSHQGSGTA